jgi:predicted methyltransferase
VIHELPDQERFFADVHAALKPGGKVLVAEPRGHVKVPEFRAMLQVAAEGGFRADGKPAIPRSRTVVLVKT